MNTFNKARIKLTAWYLVIITVISILFSLVIYTGVNNELQQFERMQRRRASDQQRMTMIFRQYQEQQLEQGLPVPSLPPELRPENIEEARMRIILILVLVNLGILGISGLAGYFLAGKTLKPIQEMLDEQNRFITDASHELRTPLTSLKSEIEVSLRDEKMTEKETKNLLKSNLEEVNKLQTLSDSLIKITQYQKKNNQLEFEEVDIKDVTDEAMKKINGLVKQKQIDLKNDIKSEQVFGDKQGLIELLVILLDNAIKYSPEKSDVILSSEVEDKSVVISVSDEGIGIEEKDLAHIFDRFYRVDKSRTKSSEVSGYGLGLSIAKQIVEKHEGTIKAVSTFGKGTTFIVQLPLA